MANDEVKRHASDDRFDTVLGFLGIEAIALVCFGFAGTTGLTFLRAIGFCIALFLFPYAKRMLDMQKANKKVFLPLIPVGVTVILLGFSGFWMSLYSGNAFSGVFDALLVVLGITGFFFLGLGLKSIPWMKMEYILLGILGGLALLVLITMFYSVVRYGLFYGARFKGLVYYYDGVVFQIANEAKYLDGFKFREVSLNFAKWGGFVLASAGAGLFARSFKEDRRRFLILAAFALLGIIDLVIVPFVSGLILLIPVYLVGLLVAYFHKVEESSPRAKEIGNRVMTILFFVLLGLVVVGLIVLFADVYVGFDKSFLAKLPLIGRFFGEGSRTEKLENAISSTFFSTTASGARVLNFGSLLFGMQATYVFDLPFFEFNVLWQNGLLAFAGVIYCIFYFMKRIRHYVFDDTQGKLKDKLIVVTMILGMFLYFSFLSDEMPLRHPEGLNEIFSSHSTTLMAFTRSNSILLLFFLLGLTFSIEPKYRGAIEETVPESDEKTVLEEASRDE